MSAFARRSDHAAVALSRRAMPFQIPSVAAIMTPIAEELTRVEQAFWEIFDARFVANASGHALRLLGRLVNEVPRDDGDVGLRFRIGLKIRAILSDETRQDFVEILGLLTGTEWEITEAPGWAMFAQNDGTVVSKHLLTILHIASADGVRVDLVTNETADDPFLWPSTDGAVPGSPWQSSDGAETGAPWQGVRVA